MPLEGLKTLIIVYAGANRTSTVSCRKMVQGNNVGKVSRVAGRLIKKDLVS